MTGFFIALAVFVAGHGDGITQYQHEEASIIYQSYYSGRVCEYMNEETSVAGRVVRDCGQVGDYDREDDFYVVFDLKTQSRERFWKTQLLWYYVQQFYPFTK